jgi:hypothetical protein
MICLRGNKWHNILGAFLFCIFCLQVSQTWSNDDQFLFVLFFGFKIVCLSTMQIVSFCQLPSKKFMSRSDKEGFFVQLKVGDDANIFVFVSIFLIILEVVN